jgi:virginiamycin B lyase
MRLLARVVCSGLVCAFVAATPSATIRAFPVRAGHPHGVVYDPAGPLQGLWFDNRTTDARSSVVEFDTRNGSEKPILTPTPGSQPGSITIAADNSIWFTESAANNVATVTLKRTIEEYPVPTKHAIPLDITRGPDGAMWFVEEAAGKIGRIARDGTIKEFVVGDRDSQPTALITGPDKAIWFTEVGTNKIGRLTTSGSLRFFSAGAGKMTGDITAAIDGSFWFGKRHAVTRLTATGALTEHEISNAVNTGAIFGSRNGGVFVGVMDWDGTGSVTYVRPDGKLEQFDLPQRHLMPAEFGQTADGAFWMAVDSFNTSASVAQLFNLPKP